MPEHFFRPFRLDHVVTVRVTLPTGQEINLGCEARGRDFADQDVSLLERLRPYLTAIIARAQGRALALRLRSEFALTRREAEVLALVVRGRSNRAIAATLFLSPGTVRKHLEHLYSKLGVKTRTKAASRALAACRASDTVASQGGTNAEIAAQLGLAPGTVKNHLERVYAKLEVTSRTEASARILGLLHRERWVSATAG